MHAQMDGNQAPCSAHLYRHVTDNVRTKNTPRTWHSWLQIDKGYAQRGVGENIIRGDPACTPMSTATSVSDNRLTSHGLLCYALACKGCVRYYHRQLWNSPVGAKCHCLHREPLQKLWYCTVSVCRPTTHADSPSEHKHQVVSKAPCLGHNRLHAGGHPHWAERASSRKCGRTRECVCKAPKHVPDKTSCRHG